jgi:signal recognition particle receptor subunit beta
MAVYKLLLNGPPDSGKTETIKAVSDLPLVSVLKKIARTQNAINLDYGRVHVSSDMCYLYASAVGSLQGPDWEGLAKEMDGLLYVVDGSKVNLSVAYELLFDLMSSWSGPIIIGVNGVNKAEYSEETYSEMVKTFGTSLMVYPYNALARNSVLTLIEAAISLMSVKKS